MKLALRIQRSWASPVSWRYGNPRSRLSGQADVAGTYGPLGLRILRASPASGSLAEVGAGTQPEVVIGMPLATPPELMVLVAGMRRWLWAPVNDG